MSAQKYSSSQKKCGFYRWAPHVDPNILTLARPWFPFPSSVSLPRSDEKTRPCGHCRSKMWAYYPLRPHLSHRPAAPEATTAAQTHRHPTVTEDGSFYLPAHQFNPSRRPIYCGLRTLGCLRVDRAAKRSSAPCRGALPEGPSLGSLGPGPTWGPPMAGPQVALGPHTPRSHTRGGGLGDLRTLKPPVPLSGNCGGHHARPAPHPPHPPPIDTTVTRISLDGACEAAQRRGVGLSARCTPQRGLYGRCLRPWEGPRTPDLGPQPSTGHERGGAAQSPVVAR